jgi:Zn-dependent M28 family amino/carboxypeptidase
LRVSAIPSPFPESASFARSDQITFAKAGVPALLVMEGPDYRHTAREAGLQRLIKWGQEVYHTPVDDLQQSINLAAAEQHVQVLLALGLALANGTSEPQWKKGVPYLAAHLQAIAEKR